jgi:hypothetical protein
LYPLPVSLLLLLCPPPSSPLLLLLDVRLFILFPECLCAWTALAEKKGGGCCGSEPRALPALGEWQAAGAR